MSALATKHISKNFDGVKAVDDLSVAFERRKITGIVGPNGSGKSTLINVLTGVMGSDGGEIVVDSVRLRDMSPYDILDYGITRTFQQVRLFEQMTALDNALLVLTERSVLGSLFERHTPFHLEQATVSLKRVGLWNKRDEFAENLSYGERKLLEIARVLAVVESRGAGTILFDEPFAGLFPEMVKLVEEILKELREKGGAVVLIEHNMDIIRELADHLIVMDAGRLLAEGEPAKVLRSREVIEAYLGE